MLRERFSAKLLLIGPSMKFRSRQAAAATICFAALFVAAIANLAARAEQPQMSRSMMMQHQHMHGGMQPPSQTPPSSPSDDPRQLVSMPAPMREHMLANMRDHLATLDALIGDIGDNKFDAASKLLEERLGMSSLSLHHAAEMAPYFPQPMQDAGTSMHHAASRLALALQNASVAQTYDAMRKVNASLHEVTSSCVSCHAGYRLH
jgi:cytochrome c556